MIPKIAIMGYVSKDIIRKKYKNEVIEKIGGKAYYCSLALAAFKTPCIVFSKTAKKDRHLNKSLQKNYIRLVNFDARLTPIFENIYPSPDLDRRIFKARHDDFRFTPSKLQKYEKELKSCRFVHLAPESHNTIPLTTIKMLHKINNNLCLDIDFYIKRMQDDGHYLQIDLSEIKEVLGYVKILLVSEEDLAHIFQKKSFFEKMKYMGDLGPEEIIVTRGSKGALVYDAKKKQKYIIKSKKIKNVVDVTGSGDTFIAAYLSARLYSDDLEKCGKFAARSAEAKIQHHMALKLTEAQRKSLFGVLK